MQLGNKSLAKNASAQNGTAGWITQIDENFQPKKNKLDNRDQTLAAKKFSLERNFWAKNVSKK